MAAYASLPSSNKDGRQYELYSLMGHFLNAAQVGQVSRYDVEEVRTARSFATRKVDAYQVSAEGVKNKVMTLLLDFTIQPEEAPLEFEIWPLHSSQPQSTLTTPNTSSPKRKAVAFAEAVTPMYGEPSSLPILYDYLANRFSKKEAKVFVSVFAPAIYYDVKPGSGSYGAQTAMGSNQSKGSNHAKESSVKRSAAWWMKTKEGTELNQPGQQQAATAYKTQ